MEARSVVGQNLDGTIREENENGGLQTHVDEDYTLIDPLATKVLAATFTHGLEVKGYPEGNWRLISVRDHVNHAIMHLMQYQAMLNGLPYDDSEDHLAHAMWRLHVAVAKREMNK